MAQEEEKGFFDRLGEILNAPLPGSQGAPAQQPRSSTDEDDDDTLLERIKDILNAPLPGTPQADSSEGAAPADQQGPAAEAGTEAATPPREKTPEIDEDDLDEAWWKQDWSAFRAHQAQEGNGLALKQQRDQEKFAAYQQQEKQRFDAHQQQEYAAFVQMQGWRQAAGSKAATAAVAYATRGATHAARVTTRGRSGEWRSAVDATTPRSWAQTLVATPDVEATLT